MHCTHFPIDDLTSYCQQKATQRENDLVASMRREIVELYCPNLESGANDHLIKPLLDSFFGEELPRTTFGQAMQNIKVMGSRNKVTALQEAIFQSEEKYLKNVFVVGDSITDVEMAQEVEAAKGVAAAWNATCHMLPWATCAVAGIDAMDMHPVIQAWIKGGRPEIRQWIEDAPLSKNPEEGPYYHWLAGSQSENGLQKILLIHKELRKICEEAGVSMFG